MTRMRTVGSGIALVIFLCPLSVRAATYYVAPTGSDTAAGTQTAPFASWARAQTAAAAGDTVYFRGGTYKYTAATSTCGSTSATIDAVVLSKSGTSGNTINYWAYPGETPVFDFSGITDTTKYNCRQVGVRVAADWLYLKGLELTGTLQLNNLNHESWCVYVMGGNNNRFEMLNAHHNMGPGFFIQEGGNNTFWNCDSHENEDTLTSNGDGQSADGFGCHPDKAGNTGNLIHGCRAWWNSDDGWDFIKAQEACLVEYSWSWYHGYKPDAISGGKPVALAAGNGNGFKGGGYDMPPNSVPAVIPQHTLRFNVAFFNKANGVYANHSPNSAFFYNNTSYSNGTDFNMLGVGSDNTSSISVGTLRNNLAFGGNLTSNMNLGGLISDQYNSWDASLGITVTAADFQSVAFAPPASCPAVYAPAGTVCVPPTDTTSFAGMASARQADGSLPVLPFLRLAAGSPLIDKGIDVGLPFSGAAPDLGAFETGGSLGGAASTGGANTGGSKASGGAATAGGAKATGGGPSAGGTVATTGGAKTNGGSPGTGGLLATTGGVASTGGAAVVGLGGTWPVSDLSGGASNTGGIANVGGTGLANGGLAAVGGNAALGGTGTGDMSSGGLGTPPNVGSCSCRVPAGTSTPFGTSGRFAVIGLAFVGILRRRRRTA